MKAFPSSFLALLFFSGFVVSVHAAAETPSAGTVIRMTNVTDLRTVSATVQGFDQAEAKLRTPGLVKAVFVSKGNEVKEGSKLAQIEDKMLKLRLESLTQQANLFGDHLRQLEKEAATAQNLYQAHKGSEKDYAQATYSAATAKEAYTQAEASRKELADIVANDVLTSPLSGTVALVNLVSGATVVPGDRLILIVQRPLVARVTLPEANASGLRTGSLVTLKGLKNTALPAKGTITSLVTDAKTKEVTLTISAKALENQPVGQQLQAFVTTGSHKGILVEAKQVKQADGRSYVKLKKSGSVMVSTGQPRDDGMVEILTGLQEGDELAF